MKNPLRNIHLIIYFVLFAPAIAFCQIESGAHRDSIRKSRLEQELEDLGEEFVVLPKLSKDSIYHATRLRLSLYIGVSNGFNTFNRLEQRNDSKIMVDNSLDVSAEIFIKLKNNIGVSSGIGFMQSSLVLQSFRETTYSKSFSYFELGSNGVDSVLVYGKTYHDTIKEENDWVISNNLIIPVHFAYQKKWRNNVGYSLSAGLNFGFLVKHNYFARSLGYSRTQLNKLSIDLLTRHEFFYSFGGFQVGMYTKLGWNARPAVKFEDYKRNVIIAGLGFAFHFKI